MLLLLLVPVIAHSIRATDREYTQDRIGPDWNRQRRVCWPYQCASNARKATATVNDTDHCHSVNTDNTDKIVRPRKRSN